MQRAKLTLPSRRWSERDTPKKDGKSRQLPAGDSISGASGGFCSHISRLALDGVALPLTEALRMTSLLRKALLAQWPQTKGQRLPEWLSGHTADGRPTPNPHLALFPLQRPGRNEISGLGIARPQSLSETDNRRLALFLDWLCAVKPDGFRLYDHSGLECALSLQPTPAHANNQPDLDEGRVWASVTPIVLDRYPKSRNPRADAAATIARACQHSGLPEPTEVVVHPHSLLAGVPGAAQFSPLIRKPGGGKRWHCHALVIFDQPVPGPVLIGAGRFQGYGLCHSLDRMKI